MNPLLMLAMMLASSMTIVGMSAPSALSADLTDDGKPHEDPAVRVQHEVSTSGMISEVHDATGDVFLDQQNDTSHTMDGLQTTKHGRRLKRSIAKSVGDISTILTLLGIVGSAGSGVIGAIPLIIGLLIPLFFPGGDPILCVWAEREESQRLQMIGFKDTMQHIARLSATDVETSNADLRSLYYALNNDRLLFMRSDNIKSSAGYFKEFAKLHLTVNELLIYAYNESDISQSQVVFWTENVEKNLQEYIAYASYAIQQEYEDRTIRNDLEPSIANWTLLLNSTSQRELKNRQRVLYNQQVAFRIAAPWSRSGNHRWLSCWNAQLGAECVLAKCPCDDNPMQIGTGYGELYRLKCRGELFRIQAVDPIRDGVVRTCDRVGIFYIGEWGSYWSRRYSTRVQGNYWWLSRYETALTCPGTPGRHASSMRSGGCAWEVWRIEGKGKPCNEPITDRDHIQLVNTKDNSTMFIREVCASSGYMVMCSTVYVPHFVIFKADVSQGEYYRYLPSLERPTNRC